MPGYAGFAVPGKKGIVDKRNSALAGADRMNVAIAINEKYVLYAMVALQSLFLSNPDADVHVYLLQHDPYSYLYRNE